MVKVKPGRSPENTRTRQDMVDRLGKVHGALAILRNDLEDIEYEYGFKESEHFRASIGGIEAGMVSLYVLQQLAAEWGL